jgi:hypothetical protein
MTAIVSCCTALAASCGAVRRFTSSVRRENAEWWAQQLDESLNDSFINTTKEEQTLQSKRYELTLNP